MRWCSLTGHSVSSPSISKVADLLLFLRKEKLLSVSAVKGYHSALSSVFKYKLPEIWDSFALNDLIRSFEIKRPLRPVDPLSWDLVDVLDYLRDYFIEPLHSKPLKVTMMKNLFLLSLAMAKRVFELQALSCCVAFQGPSISSLHLPEFVAKTESQQNPFPQSFLVKLLVKFVGISQRSGYFVLLELYGHIWTLLLPWLLVSDLCLCLLTAL